MSSTSGTMTRSLPEEPPRGGSSPKTGVKLPLGVVRTQQMGNRGLAAASIGWTLAGCILVGFAVGAWLDKQLGTQVWTPVLFLVGVVAGFREMFRTLAQISQAPSNAAQAPSARSVPSEQRGAQAGDESPRPQVLEGSGKPRTFSVPPPPFLEEEAKRGGQEDRDAV